MTHLTGPRQRVVMRLARAIGAAIDTSGATITECTEALHEVQMRLVKLALRPWENETCPTCPKAMKARGDKIMRRKRRRSSNPAPSHAG